MKEKSFDVIIVGSGPAGAIAAKKLADAEKNVLLIERKSLPRHKICSGLISRYAQNILKKESMPIPKAVCVRPRMGKGVQIQLNMNSEFIKVPDRFYNVLRRDFDYWLVLKASEAGVEVWPNTEFQNFASKQDKLIIEMKTKDQITNQNKIIKVNADYLIGADGGASTVRKILYPDFKLEYVAIFQEYYKGKINLDSRYFYAFLDKSLSDGYAWSNQKDGQIIIGVGAFKGKDIQKFHAKFIEYLEEGYGLRIEEKIRKEGCMEPNILNRDFKPGFKFGKSNILLVGEAAGLMNIFGEGIPAAFTSGIEAANSILSHTDKTQPLSDIYLNRISKLLKKLTKNWENLEKTLSTFIK